MTRKSLTITSAIIVSCLLILILSPAACTKQLAEVAKQTAEPTPVDGTGTAHYAYRNAVNEHPPGWTGPVFKLSHAYPTEAPEKCPEDVCGWLYKPTNFGSTNYEDGWDDYMKAILAYVRKGNTLDPSGWNVEVDGELRWYHVPWMAFSSSSGREFIHGMTNERTSHLSDLLGTPHGLPNVPYSKEGFETWAFGVYNPWGGYAFGQSFDANGNPVMAGDCTTPPFSDCRPDGVPFPEGTLVAKLLFTVASPDKVGYLVNSPKWTANRHTEDGCTRAPQPVYFVQMDVAVVDERSPSRWIYGTYGYNGTIQSDDPWDRLSPLGVQWGNDPAAFPAVPDPTATKLVESSLAAVDIYEHYGCGGRFVGPVDNPEASCMSCHANGYAHLPVGSESKIIPPSNNIPPLYGFTDECTKYNETNKMYFSNRMLTGNGGKWVNDTWPQYPDNVSMDTSLQMLVAFTSYGNYTTNGEPQPCTPKN